MKSGLQISNYQLFTLMIMHSLGTATLFARGIRANQDAWIVELVDLIIGFGIIWIHTELQKNYPEKNLTEINITLMGKFFGGVVTILFAGYFFWISNLNLNETAEMISITALHKTPILAIQGIFVLTIIYLTLKDIEVMARVSEILMPVVILTLVILYILITLSGMVNLQELRPVLANGIMPVLNEAYPTYSTFPYGEDVVFLMFYCYVNKSKDVRKYAFSAIFMLGTLLIVSSIIIISVLGVQVASSSTIALIEVIKMINLGNIITRIDSLGVINIFLGGLFKAMLYFYGSVLALSTLFKIRKNILIIVMAVFLVWLNLTVMPSYVFQNFVAIGFTANYILEIYTVYIPVLILVIIWLKNLTEKTG